MFTPTAENEPQDYLDAAMFENLPDWTDEQSGEVDERGLFERACKMLAVFYPDADNMQTDEVDALFESWQLNKQHRLLHGARLVTDQLKDEAEAEEQQLRELKQWRDEHTEAVRDVPLIQRPIENDALDDASTARLHELLATFEDRGAFEGDDTDEDAWEAHMTRRYREVIGIVNAPQATRAVALRAFWMILGQYDTFELCLSDDPRPDEHPIPIDYEQSWVSHLMHEILARLGLGTYPDDGDPYDAWEACRLFADSIDGVNAMSDAELVAGYRAWEDDADSAQAQRFLTAYRTLVPAADGAACAWQEGGTLSDDDAQMWQELIEGIVPPEHRYWLRPGLVSTRFPMSVTWADLGLDGDEAD